MLPVSHRSGSAVFLCALLSFAAFANSNEAISSQPAQAEAIAFSGLKLGDKVAELLLNPNSTAVPLCKAVGSAGRVYSVAPSSDLRLNVQPLALECPNLSSHVLQPRNFPAPELYSASDDPGYVYEYYAVRTPIESFVAPELLDSIVIAADYRELYGNRFGKLNIGYVHTAFFNALKPSGVLVIADRFAVTNGQPRDPKSSVTVEKIKRDLTIAGFSFLGSQHQGDRTVLKFRRP